MVVNMEIGLITPPVGLNLFVTSAVTGMSLADSDQGRDAVADDLARLLGIDHLCTEYLDGLAELAGHVSAAVTWLAYVNKRLVARCSSRFFVGGVLYARRVLSIIKRASVSDAVGGDTALGCTAHDAGTC